MKRRKVTVVGCGAVGQAILNSIVNQGIAEDIVLVDYFNDVAKGNAYDLLDGRATFPHSFSIREGTKDDYSDTDVIVITAGMAQKPGQSRLELVGANIKIAMGIVNDINESDFGGIIVVVSNPVDIITATIAKHANVGPSRVVGTGTSLDTNRLRNKIAEIYNVSPLSVEGYILGEHGDTSFFAYDATTIGSVPLKKIKPLSETKISSIEEYVRTRAGEIIKLKRFTAFGIGATTARVVKSVLTEDRLVLPLSISLKGMYGNRKEVYAGSPAIVTLTNGVERFKAIPLSETEQVKMKHSLSTLHNILKNFK